jgi:ribose transport system permease protein
MSVSTRTVNKLQIFKKIEPIWYIFFGCIFLFSLLSRDFLSLRNILNILLQTSGTGIMALGMTFLMISGFFDLSVGSVMALSSVVTVLLVPILGVPLSMMCGVLISIVVGMINGFLVIKAGINAFVTTLGSMIGLRGIVYLLSDEQPVICLDQKLQFIGNGSFLSIPFPFIIFLVLGVISGIILSRTIHGHNTYAIGGNLDAAKNVGIPIQRHLLLNFVFCSLTAGISGVIITSRMGSATPILGLNAAVTVITAVVLGGTRLNGGYGKLMGTIGGVLVLGIIQNGLNQLNVQVYYQILIDGLILILVIFIDSRIDRLSIKRTTEIKEVIEKS